MTVIRFLLAYSVLLFFITFMVSVGSPNFMTGVSAPTPPSFPDTSGWTAIFTISLWAIQNFVYFFQLMSVSSTIGIVGSVLLAPLIVVLLYIVLAFIRGINGG